MLTAREASVALHGAWRLARFDESGLTFFDDSIRGFWRSFWAAGLVLPFIALLSWADYVTAKMTVEPLRYGLIQGISYVVGWTLFPLLMFSVCGAINRESHFIRFVVANNWAAVLQTLVFAPLAVAFLSGSLPPEPAFFLLQCAFVIILIYSWFVARASLQAPGLVAAGIVAFDLVVHLTLEEITVWMM